MGKYRVRALAIAAGALLLGGCGERKQEMAGNVRVGVTCYDLSDTFISELLDCLRDTLARQEEISVTVRDAAGSQRTQDDQVEEMIEEGCRVLCVNLV